MPVNAAAVPAALAIAAIVAGSSRQQPAHPSTVVAETYRGFSFENSDCERDPDSCARRPPKNWTKADIAVVRQALDEIAARPLGSDVLTACQQRGFATLRRYTSVGPSEGWNAPDWVPRPHANLHRDPLRPSIDLNDEFFRDGDLRDPFSGEQGYLVPAAIVLHECMHTLDGVSRRTDIRALLGFVRAGARWRFAAATASQVAALTDFHREFARLARVKDRPGMWQANRRFALQMQPVRVPTMSGVRAPEEAFAEIGAHLILDSRAREYLPKEVVSYFEEQVFAQFKPK